MKKFALRCLLSCLVSVSAGLAVPFTAAAEDTIKVGEINSYKVSPAYLDHYKRGWQMALDEVNGAGGINGKKIEVISRDDNGNPGDAVRVAEELYARDGVRIYFGGFLSNVAVALNDFAKNRRVFFLLAEPGTDRVLWSEGNRYMHRFGPSSYMNVSMIVDASVALKKKRWALVYPNYEFGQSLSSTFKRLMKERQPDVEFVTEQAPPLGKIDAGAVAQALIDAKPDGIFNVLWGADLGRFVREGNTRHAFDNVAVISPLTGRPEYLDPLAAEAPAGWITTGYPYYAIRTPEHDAFLKKYTDKYKDHPRYGSVVGYGAMMAIVTGLKKANSSDSEKLVDAFKGLTVNTPYGLITMRAQDNQSTFGSFVGKISKKPDGTGFMSEIRFVNGAAIMPSDEEVKKLRVVN